MGGLSHEDYYPRLCDRSRRRRDDRLWALGSLHSDQRKDRTPPERLRTDDPNSSCRFWPDCVAQALRLLLVIFHWENIIEKAVQS